MQNSIMNNHQPTLNSNQLIKLSQPYKLHRGGTICDVEIAFESWGKLNRKKDNVILLLTGLSPDAHAASSARCPRIGWWEFMLGEGKPIDTNKYFVICVNSFGSCKGSTGPTTINTATGVPFGPDFPVLSIEDIACTAKMALQEMGIERVNTIVGTSMGGMSALAYALLYPDRVDQLAIISSAPRATPFAIAIRSLQREAIRSDPNWASGWYYDDEYPISGMRLARKLGVISYRSAEEWMQRFGRSKVDDLRKIEAQVQMEFEVESYLEAHAQRFVGSFDPNSYLALSHAMDLFDVDDYGQNIQDAFSQLSLKKALVIGVHTDILFPEAQQKEIAEALQNSGTETSYLALDSLQGHDAFLVDKKQFSPPIREFLNT